MGWIWRLNMKRAGTFHSTSQSNEGILVLAFPSIQKGPKGIKMVNPNVDHLGPFLPIWTLLDHFRQKWIFSPNGQSRVWRRCFGANKSTIVWNGPKGCRAAQKGPKWSKTLRLAIFIPVGLLWNVNKPAMFGHFLFKMDLWKKKSKIGKNSMKKMAIFCHFLAMKGKLWVRNKFSSHI